MRVLRAHCLFEQSGTFKNEFIKLGIPAEDYDVLNNFDETDHFVDIFQELEKGFRWKKSIFDKIEKEDIVLSFFPCTRFEEQIMLSFRGDNYGMKDWDEKSKLLLDMKLGQELFYLYDLICKMAYIAFDRNIRMIIENPYSKNSFLTQRFALKPDIIDRDRCIDGDYFKKPTQYFFINCKPERNNLTDEANYNATGDVVNNVLVGGAIPGGNRKEIRSMIHPDYANRFIRKYILDGGGTKNNT